MGGQSLIAKPEIMVGSVGLNKIGFCLSVVRWREKSRWDKIRCSPIFVACLEGNVRDLCIY